MTQPKKFKGIILAGGFGTRLYPLTKYINKHLLPVYDKPMIYYPLSTLLLADINEILIITTPNDLQHYEALLGNGSKLGISISYAIQTKPNGLAEALIIAEDFIGRDNVALILGDNIFYGQDLIKKLAIAKDKLKGAVIFAYYVDDPKRYGVVAFENNRIIDIVEKPINPPSHYAVTGLYFYNHDAIQYAKSLNPSERNELEITDLNRLYLKQNNLDVEFLGRGYAWLDMGTYESLMEASQFVALLEQRQGLKIACPEEIAWRKKYISRDELKHIADTLSQSRYGKYLHKLIQHQATVTDEVYLGTLELSS